MLTVQKMTEKPLPKNKIDEYTQKIWLGRLLRWNPEWLENDEFNKLPPPIIDLDGLEPMSLFYESHHHYLNVMIPLLTLEFWHNLRNDYYNESEKRMIEGTIIEYSIEDLTSEDLKYGVFYFGLKAVLDPTELQKKYPLRGDLVVYKHPNKREELFAHVLQFQFRKIEDERIELIYTLATKAIVIKSSLFDKLKLTSVTSTITHFALIKSLELLSNSPLHHLILQPTVEGYELSSFDHTQSPSFLITEDCLNSIQLEVVSRIKRTIDEKDAKICLVQGPPGTGKTTVIANAIASLLLAESNRRILVCAHSNQAVDEIVLRLLKIQNIFHANGLDFNMVRVGQDDKMNEMVKKISLSTLAREEEKLEESIFDGEPNAQELRILSEANVIATTLMSSCSYQMTKVFGQAEYKIPICIVDEAAQATELGTIAPLMLGVEKLILIGDTKQLGPIVHSMKAAEMGLNKSLFARVEKIFEKKQAHNPIIILNTQYRMGDSIVHWPNRYFYRSTLRNASIVNHRLPITSYKLFNHKSPQGEDNYSNLGEANLVVNILNVIMMQLSEGNIYDRRNIGIITPYNKQRILIMKQMKTMLKRIKEETQCEILAPDVNTVDSFQGSERDIIIISCVRSTGIGFVNDPHRLCVSLTRAKYSLIICGNFDTFYKNIMWRDLLRNAESRNVLIDINYDATIDELREHVIDNKK